MCYQYFLLKYYSKLKNIFVTLIITINTLVMKKLRNLRFIEIWRVMLNTCLNTQNFQILELGRTLFHL